MLRYSTICLVLALPACDGGTADEAKSEAAAKAEAEEKKAAEALAQRKAEREAKDKQEADAEAALEAELDALAVLPDKLPKKLDAACKAMTSAYDAYMRTVLQGDMLTKWETGGNDMGIKVFDRECHKKASIPIAACQAEALKKMTPEMEKQIGPMMQRCAAKFGDGAKAPGRP